MNRCLSTGGVDDPFLTRILQSIYQANKIELAVSFIKSSGLELLYQALVDALTIRHAKLTVLTSDYLDITDPQALRMLMLLAERGADIYLFQAENTFQRIHPNLRVGKYNGSRKEVDVDLLFASVQTLGKSILDPLDLAVGQEFKREDIPELFGVTFNPGNWHSGHVVLKDKKVHILFVTLNKQGHDYFIDNNHFHWQSQNTTKPENKRGSELIDHEKLGISIYLFIRENKLTNKKSVPFRYYGPVRYKKHDGSAPMSII